MTNANGSLHQHRAAAARQESSHILTLHDAELNTTFVSLSAGAGVDKKLIDLLDHALTSAPPGKHVLILIERSRSS